MTLNPCNVAPATPSLAARRHVRRALDAAGPGYQYPVVAVQRAEAPEWRGHSFFHTTPSGKTIVRYPNAYKWRTLYHPSTRRIVVGLDWLLAAGFLVAPVCTQGRWPAPGARCA